MTDQKDRFVFVVNEVKSFSRPSISTISTINRHVAKYAHSQRQRHPDTSNCTRRYRPCLKASDEAETDQAQSRSKRSPGVGPNARLASASHHGIETKNMPRGRLAELGMVTDHKSLLKYKSNTGKSSKRDTELQDNAAGTRIPKALSPLLIYPANLTTEEQSLMHHWFTRVFPEDFSTTLQFDGFMGPLSRYPTTFSVPLRWAIAKSAERLLGDENTDATRLVYRSRSKAMEEWRSVMSNPYMSTDEVLASAVYTIVKNDGNERIHLKGLDTIIVARGGVDTVLRETKIVQPEHIIHMYTFAPYTIDTYNELASLKAAFFTAFTYIRDGIRSSLSSPVNDIGITGDYPLEKYDVLSEATVVGQHIRLAFDTDSDYSLKARYFCAMLMLNLSLLSLDSMADRIEFLRQLDRATNAAAFPDPITGQLRIRAGAFVFIVGHIYGSSLKTIKSASALESATELAKAAIATMKIFGLLSDSLQLRFFSRLQHGLIYLSGGGAESLTRFKGCFSKDLGDFPIFAISEEIDRLWLKHKNIPKANLIFNG